MEVIKNKVIKIHPVDNVLVALAALLQDKAVAYENVSYKLVQPIQVKHKFFVQDLKQGDEIKMYSVTVGKVTTLAVKTGEQMTVHNVKHAAELYTYKNLSYQWQLPGISTFLNQKFNGNHRKDGRVGTSNY